MLPREVNLSNVDKYKLNNFIGSFEILATGIIWGFIGFFVKELSLLGSSAELSAFFRVFFAFVFALVVSLIKYGPSGFRLTKVELFWCALNGILTQGLFNIALNLSVEYTGVTIATILEYTSPVFNAIISYIAFKEKLGIKKNLILLLNIVGCIVAATGMDFTFKTISLFGIIMGILGGFLYGASPVLGKYANRNPHLFVVIAYNEFFASLFMLIFIRPFSTVNFISTKMWIYGIMYGVLITGCAYMFYYDGVKRLTELNKVPVLASIETVVAALVGFILYKEKLNIYNYLGIVIVLISIVLMSYASKRRV